MRLSAYIKPISSPSFDWIVFLNLSHLTCARTDLVQISQLPNIGALIIGPKFLNEEAGLDDSVIRSWTRVAATSNAFSRLRLLSFRSQKDISHTIFNDLAHFPALVALIVEDCKLGPQHGSYALSFGWRHGTWNSLKDYLVKEGQIKVGWDAIMHASFQENSLRQTETLTVERTTSVDALPRLILSLGGLAHEIAPDIAGNDKLWSFLRTPSAASQENPRSASSPNKRPLHRSYSSGRGKARKRPALRTSKEQNMEAFLMGFDG